VENECTLHNSTVLTIFGPKIKVVGHLTKLSQKQFWLFFETWCNLVPVKVRWHSVILAMRHRLSGLSTYSMATEREMSMSPFYTPVGVW